MRILLNFMRTRRRRVTLRAKYTAVGHGLRRDRLYTVKMYHRVHTIFIWRSKIEYRDLETLANQKRNYHKHSIAQNCCIPVINMWERTTWSTITSVNAAMNGITKFVSAFSLHKYHWKRFWKWRNECIHIVLMQRNQYWKDESIQVFKYRKIDNQKINLIFPLNRNMSVVNVRVNR